MTIPYLRARLKTALYIVAWFLFTTALSMFVLTIIFPNTPGAAGEAAVYIGACGAMLAGIHYQRKLRKATGQHQKAQPEGEGPARPEARVALGHSAFSKVATEPFMYCNYCGRPNPSDARFCSACGRSITRAPAGGNDDCTPVG